MKVFKFMIFAFCLILSLRISVSERLVVTMWIIGNQHIYSVQNGHEICNYRNAPTSEIILQITGLSIYATFGNLATSDGIIKLKEELKMILFYLIKLKINTPLVNEKIPQSNKIKTYDQ